MSTDLARRDRRDDDIRRFERACDAVRDRLRLIRIQQHQCQYVASGEEFARAELDE